MIYGVIDETTFLLRYPRTVDVAAETLEQAFEEVRVMLEMDEGIERLAIVRARWSERRQAYVETGEGCIQIDVSQFERDEDDE